MGPNGSGKSNVIDSLLFVFGFKAKKLRQGFRVSLILGKLSDLIHVSAQFPSLTFCHVIVHFSQYVSCWKYMFVCKERMHTDHTYYNTLVKRSHTHKITLQYPGQKITHKITHTHKITLQYPGQKITHTQDHTHTRSHYNTLVKRSQLTKHAQSIVWYHKQYHSQ